MSKPDYKKEIIQLIAEILEIDIEDVSEALEITGFSLDELVKDLEIGIANGYSKEFQFDLIRKTLINEQA